MQKRLYNALMTLYCSISTEEWGRLPELVQKQVQDALYPNGYGEYVAEKSEKLFKEHTFITEGV